MFMSPDAQLYYIACEFLWSSITLFHYLSEEVATENIGKLQLKWSGAHEDLASWALEERFFAIESEVITKNEQEKLLSTTETLGDTLVFRWGDALNTFAGSMLQKSSYTSKSKWLYFSYCRFLKQVLVEFNRVIQEMEEMGGSPAYYEHYQESIELFNDMAAAMERERPFLDNQNGVDEDTKQAVWAEMDAFAAKLGTEWRQAVLSAARNLKLPDFDDKVA